MHISKQLTFCPLQVVEDGYEFFAKRQLVTLFSAPNYCGEFDNAGGMMSVDETLMCSFQVCSHAVFSQSYYGIIPYLTLFYRHDIASADFILQILTLWKLKKLEY